LIASLHTSSCKGWVFEASRAAERVRKPRQMYSSFTIYFNENGIGHTVLFFCTVIAGSQAIYHFLFVYLKGYTVYLRAPVAPHQPLLMVKETLTLASAHSIHLLMKPVPDAGSIASSR
jgi:hypothetical protein